MELHKQYGNKWVQIQKFMPGRIDNDIKNRFNASLRKYKSFDEYLESIDKKRSKHKNNGITQQHSQNQKTTISQLDEWKNKYDFKNSASQAISPDNDFLYHKEKSDKSLSNDGKRDEERDKKSRHRPRDEKCNRKHEEKIKRRIRKHSIDKTEDLIHSSCSDSEDKDDFEMMNEQITGNIQNETIVRRKAHRQFSNSEDKKMEACDIEEVIQKVSVSKGYKKNEAHK